MFQWRTGRDASRHLLSTAPLKGKGRYFALALDILRETLLARELDKSAAMLALVYFNFGEFYELCVQVCRL